MYDVILNKNHRAVIKAHRITMLFPQIKTPENLIY